MGKKILQLVICCIVISLILLLGTHSISKIKEKKIIEGKIQVLPSFCALSIINSNEFCTDSLPDKPVLLMFMSPDCDFCQEEIKQLIANRDEFQNISILLVTSAKKAQAKDFYISQKLSQINNLQFLSDEEMKITDLFDVNIIPSIFLYDKDKKLIHKINGEIKIETLIKYLSE